MKGTSKMIMGATLVTVLTLAIVFSLILVLLAELYCSLLLRRRHHLRTTTTSSIATPSYPTLNNNNNNNVYYAQGVLHPPRSFLFPSIPHMEEEELNANESCIPHGIGLVSVPSPLASFINRAPPISPKQAQQELEHPPLPLPHPHDDDDECSSSVTGEDLEHHLVYISNPIYENQEEEKEGKVVVMITPFETPQTSPSQLDDLDLMSPMKKKLPDDEEASSLSLSITTRDRGGGTLSASDQSHSNNNCIYSASSSSSFTPSTSPSW